VGKHSARGRSTTGPSAIHHRRETDAGVAGELIVYCFFTGSSRIARGSGGERLLVGLSFIMGSDLNRQVGVCRR
jgi:hypothetical protein